MTAQQLVEHGLCDPVRVFVKNEPHPISKIAQNRFRIISSVSIVDFCIESWFSHSQNTLEISQWESLPAKPGMGLDDESLAELFRSTAPIIVEKECISTDIIAWDWSVKWWELELEAQVRARQFSNFDAIPTPVACDYENIILNRYFCAALAVRSLSNGTMWAQVTPGIMISGRKNTSSGNSHIRVFTVKLRDQNAFVMAMGDDCVEEYFPGFDEYYARLGHPIKTDFRVYSAKTVEEVEFQFCSTRIRWDKDKQMVVGEPLNWVRIFFRLLSNLPSIELLDQFRNEMRHSPQLKRCLDILDAVGWVAAKFSKQGAFPQMAKKKGKARKSLKGKRKVALKSIMKKASSVGAQAAVKAAIGATKKVVHVAGPKRPAARTTSRIHEELQQNADAFMASIHKPFSIRGMRLPEPGPFPSVVGSFTQRFPLTTVVDSSIPTQSYASIMLWPSFYQSGATQGPIWTLSTMTNGVPAWTTQAWNTQTTLATNFFQIRPVSCGFRFINTGPKLSRGGIGYVLTSSAAPPTTAATLGFLTGSEEAIELDMAQVDQLGDELIWTPIDYQPVTMANTSNAPAQNLYTYIAPSYGGNVPIDNKVMLWCNFPSSNVVLNLAIEVVVNWEAIPFPQNESLFDRKVVVGSQDAVAVSVEKTGVQGTPSATWSAFGNAALDAIGTGAAAGLSGGGFKGAIAAILPQVPSLIKKLGAGIASLFSADDYANHLLACGLGVHHLSPAHVKAHKGLTREEFLRVLAEMGIGITFSESASVLNALTGNPFSREEKEEKDSGSPSDPPAESVPHPSYSGLRDQPMVAKRVVDPTPIRSGSASAAPLVPLASGYVSVRRP